MYVLECSSVSSISIRTHVSIDFILLDRLFTYIIWKMPLIGFKRKATAEAIQRNSLEKKRSRTFWPNSVLTAAEPTVHVVSPEPATPSFTKLRRRGSQLLSKLHLNRGEFRAISVGGSVLTRC